MAYASSLCKRGNTYYFRVRIPHDLKSWFKRDDLKRTLRTKSLTSAKRLCKLWNCKTEELFTVIRSGILTDIQIKQVVADYLDKTLKSSDEFRLMDGPRLMDFEGVKVVSAPYGEFIQRAADDIENGRQDYIGPIVDSFLEEQGIQVDKDSLEYKKLCRDIALAHIEVMITNERRDLGDFSDPYYQRTATTQGTVSEALSAQQPAKPSRLLSEVIDRYIEDQRRASGKRSDSSVDEYAGTCNRFPWLMGDRDITSFTKDDLRRFADVLPKLPPRLNTNSFVCPSSIVWKLSL